MSRELSSSELRNILTEAVKRTIGWNLTDDELTQLISGSPIPLQDLLKNRSLSEFGSGLIRAEALTELSQLSDSTEARFSIIIAGARFCVMIAGTQVCISIKPTVTSDHLALETELLNANS
jgi:hypothetical protein